MTFDFELQAAASDDAILLSLGPQHSFPLERVPTFLASATRGERGPAGGADLADVRRPLAVEPEHARWPCCGCAAASKNPPAIQRMEADDLMAAVFPTLAACQENVAPGPIEIPDHLLVRQTLDGLPARGDGHRRAQASWSRGIESGRVTVVVRDTVEPSVLAHEILNGRPFTYLDDAPLEERRCRAVPLRRGLPVEPRELARLDPAAIERVRAGRGPTCATPTSCTTC